MPDYKLNMFCPVTAYVDESIQPARRSLITSQIRFYRGKVADSLDPQHPVTHVFVDRVSRQRVAELKRKRRQLKGKKLFRIMDADFVDQSIRIGALANEDQFEL